VLSEKTDQFITRQVGDAVLTELIIRLCNDFPTTEREVRLASISPRSPLYLPYISQPPSARWLGLPLCGVRVTTNPNLDLEPNPNLDPNPNHNP